MKTWNKSPSFFLSLSHPSLSVVCVCFFHLDPAQNDALVTSGCVHFIFCRGRELKPTDESVLPVTAKERKREGKRSIGPRLKNECANSPSTKNKVRASWRHKPVKLKKKHKHTTLSYPLPLFRFQFLFLSLLSLTHSSYLYISFMLSHSLSLSLYLSFSLSSFSFGVECR